MSWAEIVKAVNNDLSTPLNAVLYEKMILENINTRSVRWAINRCDEMGISGKVLADIVGSDSAALKACKTLAEIASSAAALNAIVKSSTASIFQDFIQNYGLFDVMLETCADTTYFKRHPVSQNTKYTTASWQRHILQTNEWVSVDSAIPDYIEQNAIYFIKKTQLGYFNYANYPLSLRSLDNSGYETSFVDAVIQREIETWNLCLINNFSIKYPYMPAWPDSANSVGEAFMAI